MFQGKTKRGVDIDQLNGFERKKNDRCWLVVGDRSRFRVYVTKENLEGNTDLIPIGEIKSPDGKKNDRELGSDRPGRSFLSHTTAHHGQTGAPRHALSSRQSPTEHAMEELVRHAVAFLDEGWKAKKFDSLHLYAEPHLLGILRGHLDKALADVVTKTEERDYAWLTDNEIKDRLM